MPPSRRPNDTAARRGGDPDRRIFGAGPYRRMMQLSGAATWERLEELKSNLRAGDREDPSLALRNAILAIDNHEIADLQGLLLMGPHRDLDDWRSKPPRVIDPDVCHETILLAPSGLE